MFKTTEVECPQRPIRTYGDEDVGRAREPCDVVDFTIMCDQLSDSGGGIDVPNGTRCVYRRSDDKVSGFLVPGEVG